MAGQGAFGQHGAGSQMPSTLPGAPGAGGMGGHPQIASLLQSLLGGAAQGMGQNQMQSQQSPQGGMNAGGGQGLLWNLLNGHNQNQ